MIYLVSACLLGTPCRYDGAARPVAEVVALRKEHTLIPVCPECLGGLPTPRKPAERQGDRVIRCDGCDVTREYCRGADEAVRLARLHGVDGAILKSKSPACGVGLIYDGSFTRTLTAGNGVAAEALIAAGIPVCDEHAPFFDKK